MWSSSSIISFLRCVYTAATSYIQPNYWNERCFFCGKKHHQDDMVFSWEWDAFVHPRCYQEALDNPDAPMHTEAVMMEEEMIASGHDLNHCPHCDSLYDEEHPMTPTVMPVDGKSAQVFMCVSCVDELWETLTEYVWENGEVPEFDSKFNII